MGVGRVARCKNRNKVPSRGIENKWTCLYLFVGDSIILTRQRKLHLYLLVETLGCPLLYLLLFPAHCALFVFIHSLLSFPLTVLLLPFLQLLLQKHPPDSAAPPSSIPIPPCPQKPPSAPPRAAGADVADIHLPARAAADDTAADAAPLLRPLSSLPSSLLLVGAKAHQEIPHML